MRCEIFRDWFLEIWELNILTYVPCFVTKRFRVSSPLNFLLLFWSLNIASYSDMNECEFYTCTLLNTQFSFYMAQVLFASSYFTLCKPKYCFINKLNCYCGGQTKLQTVTWKIEQWVHWFCCFLLCVLYFHAVILPPCTVPCLKVSVFIFSRYFPGLLINSDQHHPSVLKC